MSPGKVQSHDDFGERFACHTPDRAYYRRKEGRPAKRAVGRGVRQTTRGRERRQTRQRSSGKRNRSRKEGSSGRAVGCLVIVGMVAALVVGFICFADSGPFASAGDKELVAVASPAKEAPTDAPAPTPEPTATHQPQPTPAPTRDEELASARQLMLELINEARADAGSPPVVLGSNRAAQVHADNHLAGCFGGHWGLDGTKSYMRYALAGGYQTNAENTSGLEFCIRAEHGYAAIRSTEYGARQAMDGLLDSPGHRRAILDPVYRKVNLGIAWDRFNFRVVQQFEGDYVEYSRLPAIEGDRIAFAGEVKNGVVFGLDQGLHVQIAYHPPLRPLTPGQVARAYCVTPDRPVAYLREPPTGDWYYPDDTLPTTYSSCGDPRDVPPDAPTPQSYQEALELSKKVRAASPLVQIPASMDAVTASRWKVSGGSFSITADIGDVLDEHGPGIYTVILFGSLDGDLKAISEYSIFHGVPRPAGYD